MNNSYQQEERELLLIDYIYRVLSHWRSVVVSALVCAVVFGGVKYFKDLRDLEAQVQKLESTTPREQVEEMLGQMSAKEAKEARLILQLEEYITEQQEYRDKAAIMKLNRSEVDEIVLQYHVKMDGSKTELLKSYKTNFLTDDVANEIAEMSEDMDTKDVQTMISASCDENREVRIGKNSAVILNSDVSSYESLYITVRGFSKDEVTVVSEVVKKAVSDYSKKAQSIYGEHKMVLVNDGYQKCMDEYVATIQDEVYENISDMQYQVNLLTDKFSEGQKSVIAYYISNLGQEDETIGSEGLNSKVSIDKKWIVIGLFLGLCIIAIWQFFVWVFGGKVNSPEELNGSETVYNFGICRDKENKGNHGLFRSIDNLMYSLCYRGRLKLTRNELFSIILSHILEKAKLENIEKVYLTNVGKLNEQTKTFCQELIEAAQKNSVQITMGEYPCSNADELPKMVQHDYVIICDNMSDMKYNDYIRLLQMCKEYNVKVMGTFYLV